MGGKKRLLGKSCVARFDHGDEVKNLSRFSDISIKTDLVADINNTVAPECVLCRCRMVDFKADFDHANFAHRHVARASCTEVICVEDVDSEARVASVSGGEYNAQLLRKVENERGRGKPKTADNSAYGSW